jgi:hypothetical protein
MKTIFTFFLALTFSFTSFSQSISWSNEQIVANGNTYGYVRPRIVTTTGNIPVVMWGGGTSGQPLYVARWNGTGFGTPVPVTPMNVDPFIVTWAGADIAAYGNDVYVVFKREPEMSNNIYIVKSSDGGITWSDTTRVDGSIGPYDRFPTVAVNWSGNPYVMFMTFDMSWLNATYVVTRSTDGGQTFSTPVPVSTLGGSDVCDCCPGYVIADGNNVATAWRRNNNNTRDMWAGISTDNAMTFPTGLDVDNTNWMLSSCPSSGPHPYLDTDSLFTVFMSGASGDNRVYINTKNITNSMNGYTSMLLGSVPSAAIQNYPFTSGNKDTLATVWQQSLSGNTDVYFAWSISGSEALVNSGTVLNNTNGLMQNPHIAYKNGIFHVVFTDATNGNVIYKRGTFLPNGVGEINYENALNVFPNPSAGNVTLDLSAFAKKDTRVRLTDITGKIVYENNSGGTNNLVLPHQLPGIYFAEVTSGGISLVRRKVIFN